MTTTAATGGNPSSIEPLTPDAGTLDGWSREPGLALRVVQSAVPMLPRGRFVTSRWIGRNLFGAMRRTLRMPDGHLVAIDPRNLDVYLINADGTDVNVNLVLRAVDTLLRSTLEGSGGGVFYDIGANAGFVSLAIAQRFGDAVGVVAFEPQPVLAERVAISARLNGFRRVEVYSLLLGDRAGEMELFVPAMGVTASSVWWDHKTRGVAAIRRPVERLDALVESGRMPPPTLIKIDVEGAEHMVLAGATATLTKHRPLVLFESFTRDPEQRAERERILALIRSAAAYDFYFVEPDGFRRVREGEQSTCGDLLAVPSGWTPPARYTQ